MSLLTSSLGESQLTNESSLSSSSLSSSNSEGGPLYILLAIGSPIVFSLTNIVDKTAVSMRVKHTPSYIIMIGLVDMIVGLIIAACCDWSPESLQNTKVMDFFFPVISAVAWALFIYCYYVGMLLADASIIVGVEYLYPLVVLALSAIFLHERIQPLGYLGCALLVVGAISLSLNFIGIIHKKCKKCNTDDVDDGLNRERRVVLGSKCGPFQNSEIPAGAVACINNADSSEEARAAFNAILVWRGNFVMPIMKESNGKSVDKSYVDTEAGCAPGVSCWFPCGAWCSNCSKVMETKSKAKQSKKKKEQEQVNVAENNQDENEEKSAGDKSKKKKIDSRKTLESDRNAIVRCASAAAVNATVGRRSPSPAASPVGKKDDSKNSGNALLEEELKDEKADNHSHHHHKHHHRHHHSHGHHEHHRPNKGDSELQDHQLDSDSEGEDAIPLEVVSPKKESSGSSGSISDKNLEDRDLEASEDGKEEHNCVSVIVSFCQKHRDSKLLLMLVLIPLIIGIALCEFLAKVSTANLGTFNVCSINFFSFGFFMFSIIFVTPLKGAKYFISEVKRNWMFCIMSDFLTLSGQFLLIFALSGMSASVVSSLAAIQPFCTLCLERIFGIASDSIKECLGYKLIPIILVVSGVVIVSVTVI